MPTITLNKKVLFDNLGKTLSDEELLDKIPMLGTDLEEITEDEIHVEIFPNRPDLLSDQGFARAFSSFLGLEKGLKKFDIKPSGEKLIVEKSVQEVRPFTACAIVKGLTLDDEKIREIIQIQEKLHVTYGRNRKKAAIGIYPMDKITFPIKFVGMKPKDIKFQPLESDVEMNGLDILENHPTGKEYGKLLEGKKVFPIFVDSDNNVLSLPPVINSHKTGRVTDETKDVFIECSGFNYDVLSKCLNMIVTSLVEMGGELFSMEIEYPSETKVSPNLEPSKMKLDLGYINKLLGLELDEKDAKKYLEMMGFGYENGDVLIPAYRSDIMHNADFAEDIAISYGFNNFEAIIPDVATIAEESPLGIFKRKVANVLVGMGLIETKGYNLSSLNRQKVLMNNPPVEPVKLANALTIDFNILRSWMVPSLLEVIKNNKKNEYPQNIFDVGRIFVKTKVSAELETGIAENDQLGVLLCDRTVDFTTIKQSLEALFHAIDCEYELKDLDHVSFIPGRIGEIFVAGTKIGLIGEVHPSVLGNFEIEMPISVFELNLDLLFELIHK